MPGDLRVVIPAFACERSIGELVRRTLATGLPVTVVSDGSPDGTAREATLAGARVLAQPRNRGKGSALAAGFADALRLGAAGVVSLDGDSQHDPDDLPALMAAHRADPTALIIGQRHFDPALMPARSLFGNRSSRYWLRLFAGADAVLDAQCGFRIYPRWLLERHPPTTRRFEAEFELLMRTVCAGAAVKYVPIKTIYLAKGASHFRVLPDTLRVFGVALRSLTWARQPVFTPGQRDAQPRR